MEKKRCLFCSEYVPVEPKGEFDRFLGCHCAPESSYSLQREHYVTIHALPYTVKNKRFPIISGYIREKTDCGDKVVLGENDLQAITDAPTIPVTIEDKERRLLQFIYRNTKGPGDSVLIQPLSNHFNLTYSPNLQELVYIIEKLKEAQLLIREGLNFKLTDSGWSIAAASAGGSKLKDCCVLLPEDEGMRAEWLDQIFPKIEQCGYRPRLFQPSEREYTDAYSLLEYSDCKLMIADLSEHSPEIYLVAGIGMGKNIPIISTMRSSVQAEDCVRMPAIRPLMWESSEELAMLLQQRIAQ
ncbi:hypothetical protein [Paenibacillus sinopodophylli]|uniref:hypothetical protein n=1 Tax=Paenibacillus sinopodophylli TaxID=1837342 RepID=UPI00110D1277|nr:hypothetical protein [Paenibacillus sinopodophylli]